VLGASANLRTRRPCSYSRGSGDRVLVDSGLAERESVVLEAGTHEQSLRLRTADLVALCEADVADLVQD
jgi:prolyl-tRNA editing enzyme YbaK/EbsC (Cys-tRNA(Pro) deacylase)